MRTGRKLDFNEPRAARRAREWFPLSDDVQRRRLGRVGALRLGRPGDLLAGGGLDARAELLEGRAAPQVPRDTSQPPMGASKAAASQNAAYMVVMS